jgi:hypothetical protein
MDEREWLACTDPGPMLEFVCPRMSDRDLCLFNCACCRRIWHLIVEGRSRTAVEAAERYDATRGNIGQKVLAGAENALLPSDRMTRDWGIRWPAASATFSTVNTARWNEDRSRVERYSPRWAFGYAILAAGAAADDGCQGAVAYHLAKTAEMEAQAELLREILGNPFRPVVIDPVWRTTAVLALAQAAYENRTLPAGTLEPDRLAVLADALEDAGCDNAELLEHLRGPGPHVRGCWPVDAILGRS